MSEPRLCVLLAEDDPDLRVTTRMVLEIQGFDVIVAADGLEAEEILRSADVDVALLDIRMPGRDGLSLTRMITTESDLPVVLLTARDLDSDQIVGLEAGADDYITKPFNSEVLAARLRAVVRRRTSTRQQTQETTTWGDLTINRVGMTIDKGDTSVELTATEFRLLEAFLDHPGAVLSRGQLLEMVWGSSDWSDPRIIDVNVQRLRPKIGPEYIATVRGAGYKWVRP